jgi:anti-sigma B factor antagonist
MSGVEKFKMHVEEQDEARVVYLYGELDLSMAQDFWDQIEPLADRSGQPFVLNMRHLRYIDSTGIGMIISLLKKRDAMKSPFIVKEVPPKIQRLFDITGISKFLEEGSTSEAHIQKGTSQR